MTAQIIDLHDAMVRERRRKIHAVVQSRVPLAELMPVPTFEAMPHCVRPIREAIVFAILEADETEAMAAIEEFTALPVDDGDAGLVRDGLALAFCALLEQAHPGIRTSDFAAEIANRLFPIESEPKGA